MPPKKGSSKKLATKVAASIVEAEVLKNGEKVLSEEHSDAKILQNGTSLKDTGDMAEFANSKATKKSGGRAKNVSELNLENPPSRKPAAKGRAKKKSSENEVIENETDSIQADSEVVETETNVEIRTKPKGKGAGKKAEPKAKKNSKGKEDKKTSTEAAPEDISNKDEENNMPIKNTKALLGRKKKQEVVSQVGSEKEEQLHIKQEVKEEITEEVLKKPFRKTKKMEQTSPDIEPQNKKVKVIKKENAAEKGAKDKAELAVEESEKVEVKEKKITKRGRNAFKTAIATETNISTNGEIEEVLPKKRSRKAPTVEQEILKEKPKKGRTKKAAKLEEKTVENDTEEQKGTTDENDTNGLVEQEKSEMIEDCSSSNKKEENKSETAVSASAVATKATKGGRKRAAPSNNNKNKSKRTDADAEELKNVDNTEMEDETDGSKSSKTKKAKSGSVPLNATATKYIKADFDLPPPSDGETIVEPRFNFKISSWNVAGLRSWLKKDGLKFLDFEQPDIFCMQETKCTNDQLPEEVVRLPGYHPYWLCMPGGYAGVAIYSKIMPIHVEYGIGNKEFDECGRVITAEYEKFFLINVYVPNSGRKLVNLDARMKWEELFQQFVENLNDRKPVIICGDMNVSHQEHDLANPKTNTRNAGFTKEERDKMTDLLALGYVDTFRHLYPNRKGAYTFWSYMGSARSRNVGWRLDYFIVSERFIGRIVDNCIRSQCMGSDHCPITLFLKL